MPRKFRKAIIYLMIVSIILGTLLTGVSFLSVL